MKLNFNSTQLSDLHIPLKIGSDAALFRAINHLLIKNNNYDTEFINKYTNSFPDYKKSLETIDWELITRDTGSHAPK